MIAQRCLIAGIILDQITGEKSQSWYEVLPLSDEYAYPIRREPVKLSLALLSWHRVALHGVSLRRAQMR